METLSECITGHLLSTPHSAMSRQEVEASLGESVCTTESGKTLDSLLDQSGLDYISGLDLSFC